VFDSIQPLSYNTLVRCGVGIDISDTSSLLPPRTFLKLSVRWIFAVAKKKKNNWVRWTKDEIRLLKRLFPRGKARDVAEKTGRPLSAVRQKAYSMGLATRQCRLWSASEIEIVKRLYPSQTAQTIANKLGRSEGTVIAKALSIGLRKTERRPPWSKQEDALLKKLYPDQENTIPDIAKQIGRSVQATRTHLSRLGLRNKKRKT